MAHQQCGLLHAYVMLHHIGRFSIVLLGSGWERLHDMFTVRVQPGEEGGGGGGTRPKNFNHGAWPPQKYP